MKQAPQPKGLYYLAFTELWERFGFYTVQTILVLYMATQLHFTDKRAYLFYGAYSSLMYITPALGGWLADNIFGKRLTIILGGILFVVGYILCAVPNLTVFFIALSFLIVANGFFKPNVSSIVGELYKPQDPRREGGFTLFYMGINIGSLIPPLFAGPLVHHYSWHAGFLIAALGMLMGLGIFISSGKVLQEEGAVPLLSPLRDKRKLQTYCFLFIGTVIAVALFYFAFLYAAETNVLVSIAAALIICYVLWRVLKLRPENRNKMLAAIMLIIISVGFWALYNQTFSSLMLFAQRNMSKNFLGMHIDAEFTQFFNPFFIILLSPILSWLWVRLDRFHFNPPVQLKFALAILFMTAGFAVLSLAGHYFGSNGVLSPWWLVLSYFLQTIGELLLSPIGLAMITILSTRGMVSLMMGVWFLSQAGAFSIGGELATITAVPEHASLTQALGIYSHAFGVLTWMSLGLMIVSFLLLPVLSRLIGPKQLRAA